MFIFAFVTLQHLHHYQTLCAASTSTRAAHLVHFSSSMAGKGKQRAVTIPQENERFSNISETELNISCNPVSELTTDTSEIMREPSMINNCCHIVSW